MILSDVDQHHDGMASLDPYRRLNVIGTSLTPGITQELARLGFDDVRVTASGFLAVRSQEAALKIYD